MRYVIIAILTVSIWVPVMFAGALLLENWKLWVGLALSLGVNYLLLRAFLALERRGD